MKKVQIAIEGHLDRDWSEWFEGFEICHNEGGETILLGSVKDQAALYGLLARLRDLGVSLLSVRQWPEES